MVNPQLSACPPKAPLTERPLLGVALASELARVFEVLASETRLRLLHALVLLGDPCMGDLAETVGMKPQAVSNQLRRLVDLGILATRRHGTHVHYRIVDPCVIDLMHHGLCINEETKEPVPKPPRAATMRGGMPLKEGPAGRCGSSFKGADAEERPPGIVPPGWGGGGHPAASGSNHVDPLCSSRLSGGTPPGAPSAAHGGFGTGSQDHAQVKAS